MSPSRIAVISSIALAVAGCANFQAVNRTAKELLSAQTSWNAIATDYQASCRRGDLMSASAIECGGEGRATKSLEAANDILADYFKALEQASETSNFSVEPGITALASSVEGLPGANADQVDAAKVLASFLANLATRSLEERTLKRLIADGAPKAEAVLGVLHDTVVPQFEERYKTEARLTQTAFMSYLQASGTLLDLRSATCEQVSVRGLANGTGYLLMQDFCTKQQALERRKTALAAYSASLVKAQTLLAALEQGKDDLDAKALAKQIESDLSTLKKDVEGIKDVF